jgi:hypothetical protein
LKTKWYIRKDGTHVMKRGNYKVLEVFKRPGIFWCCFVFKKGKVVSGNGYFASTFHSKGMAANWGKKKAKELKIIP